MAALDGYITKIIELKYYKEHKFYTLKVEYLCQGEPGVTELVSWERKKLENYKVGDRITI